MAEHEEVLGRLGLTGNEAKAYMALNYLGPSIASDVAQKAGIHRALAYNTIARLVAKGFASEVEKDGVKVFSAISPNELRLRLEEKESALRRDVEGLVEELRKGYRSTPGVSARVFTGIDGIKAILNDELESSQDGGVIYAYKAIPEIARAAPVFTAWYHKKRIAKKLKMLFLMDRSDFSLERGEELRKIELTEVRFMPGSEHVPVTYHAYSDKVAIVTVTPEEKFGVVIQSPAISSLFRENFLAAWKKGAGEAKA
ncbi:MAG: helix-turn-helix domain-containing protein [Candidatus Micrarchaeota archaeon]